ncbi:hypothetical protein AWB76_07188 [Caballeronia temeraria]|uniref:RNA ligase domain-containing protein n=1 Tax=Caballeronia temeraria TaxID=1777137 RepID=A0A158DMQ0_9BURK|nr:RNA ligase family protein [Caballeronia temeraria]SAK95753.1 hypothetical protein AWB76_07188 [Caballeronia temeraria]
MEFVPYPKTPRLKRDIVITEKLDGTNAQVVITKDDRLADEHIIAETYTPDGLLMTMRVGSRSRWITPGKTTDNYGFAQWCYENQAELFKLGEGQHFGEWYGQGIQRGYGLDHKRFALFNTARWGRHNPDTPKCCEVVPVLAQCSLVEVDDQLAYFRKHGSRAVPGFMRPEGIIVYHTASKQNFKVLLENDQLPKGLTE